MKTRGFSVRIVFIIASVLFAAVLLEAGRDKLPVTKSKVTGSVIDLIKSNESLEAENEKLRAVQQQATSLWYVVNLSSQTVTVTPKGAKNP